MVFLSELKRQSRTRAADASIPRRSHQEQRVAIVMGQGVSEASAVADDDCSGRSASRSKACFSFDGPTPRETALQNVRDAAFAISAMEATIGRIVPDVIT